MMDIVEKLRAGTDDELLAHDLMFDAADEIERLRAVAIEKRAEADAAHGYLVEMRHEIERLLANAKQDAGYLAAYHRWCAMNGCAPSSSDLIAARAALGEEK